MKDKAGAEEEGRQTAKGERRKEEIRAWSVVGVKARRIRKQPARGEK